MKKVSLRDRIKNYLDRYGDWVSGDAIEKLSQDAGYKASTGSRRARELAEEETIERQETRKGYVEYRSKTPLKRVTYKTGYGQIITKYE